MLMRKRTLSITDYKSINSKLKIKNKKFKYPNSYFYLRIPRNLS